MKGKVRRDNAIQDQAWRSETGQDKKRRDKTIQSKARQDKVGYDNFDKTRQDGV